MKKHYTRAMQRRRQRELESRGLIHIETLYTKVLGRPYRGRSIMKARSIVGLNLVRKFRKNGDE